MIKQWSHSNKYIACQLEFASTKCTQSCCCCYCACLWYYDNNTWKKRFCLCFCLTLCNSFQPGADVQSSRATATRIPMPKGMKTGKAVVTGVSTVTRLESRAESQSMKIELKRSTVCSSTSLGGGKCWGPHAAPTIYLWTQSHPWFNSDQSVASQKQIE